MRDTDNSEDVIDVRDLTTRYDELEEERNDLEEAINDARDELALNGDEEAALLSVIAEAEEALEQWDRDNADEFKTLGELLKELEGNGGDHQWNGDWYPQLLIRRSHFVEYAQELAEDIGAVNKDAGWPNGFIDWEKAAEALEIDYSEIDYDGVEYLYR